MAKGQQRDLKREAFWRGMLSRFGRSGLSVRGFCARERLSEPSFYAWRRVITQRDARQPRPAFVPVVVEGGDQEASAAGVVIELRGGARSSGGCTLRLPAALPMAQVAELVRAIAAGNGTPAVEASR